MNKQLITINFQKLPTVPVQSTICYGLWLHKGCMVISGGRGLTEISAVISQKDLFQPSVSGIESL